MDRPTGRGSAGPAGPADLADLRATLQAAGRRWTRQRAAVYDHLQRLEHHPTAEDVYRTVKAGLPSISLATVDKALEALVASGLATRLVAANGSARYDARRDFHYHLRCSRSGLVEDLATAFDPDLIAKIDPNLGHDLETQGFRVTGYRLELIGYHEDPGPRTRGGPPS